MTKPKSIKFQGALKKPIKMGVLRPDAWPKELSSEHKRSWDEAAESMIFQEYIDECRKKLPHLFEHYKIDDKMDFECLALHLAIDFVPGFKLVEIKTKLQHGDYGAVVPVESSAIGRPKEWTNERLLNLFDDVEAKKLKEDEKTDRHAVGILAHSKKWSRPSTRISLKAWIETLESRLHDAKPIAKKRAIAQKKATELIDLAQELQAET
jgi:hypothetical protein